MVKNKTISVNDTPVGVFHKDEGDYICLTDLVKSEEGSDHIRNWMRNRNTIEFLGIWEELNNPEFKGVEFDTFKKQSGLNSFNMTPKKWIENTNAIGVISKSGRYGGTYAHKDIAYEFASWISPVFKLHLIKEFQRLKEIESNEHNLDWDTKRFISKANYHIQNEAIKNYVIPNSTYPKSLQGITYAKEADILNVAVFGYTAKEWRDSNPDLALSKQNIRDTASINELTVLSNLESMNAQFIKDGIPIDQRFDKLKPIAKDQLSILNNQNSIKSLKKISELTYVDAEKKSPLSDHNKALKTALSHNPKDNN